MKRLCAEPGCNAITDGTRCAKHTRTGWQKSDQRRPTAAARGYGNVWRAVRDRIIARDPVCRCSTYGGCQHPPGGCGRPSTDADHIKRRQDRIRDGEPPDAEENLQGMCSACHQRKTLHEVREAKKEARIADGRGGYPSADAR